MAEKRKLLAEIEKCFKKIDEGVELFEETMVKMQEANSDNQREKLQDDLKKEIKKLQRLRDQVKNWQNSSEIKDKDRLTSYRRMIETKMEQFKDVERENKTKPHSKQGLCAEEKMDPKERARVECAEWITNTIRSLNDECDKFEAGIEQLSCGDQGRRRGKGKDDPKKNEKEKELRSLMEGVKYHMDKLEVCMRLVDNETLDPKDVEDALREEMEQFISQLEEEHTIYECESAYDDLNLDQYSVVFGKHSSVDDDKHDESHSNGGHTSPSADHNSRHTSTEVPPSPALVKRVSSISSNHSPAPLKLNNDSPSSIVDNKSSILDGSIGSSISSISSPLVPPTPPPPPVIPYNSVAAGATRNSTLSQSTPLNLSSSIKTINSPSASSTVLPPLSPSIVSSTSSIPPPSPTTSIPLATTSSPIVSSSTSTLISSPITTVPLPPPSPSIVTSSNDENRAPPSPSPPSQSIVEEDSMVAVDKKEDRSCSSSSNSIISNDDDGGIMKDDTCIHLSQSSLHSSHPPSQSDEMTKNVDDVRLSDVTAMTEDLRNVLRMSQNEPKSMEPQSAHIPPWLGASPLGRAPATDDHDKHLTALEVALQRLPQQMDSERPRSYLPKMPCVTPLFYPQQAPSNADTMEYYLRLSPETLFFTFYYMEGSRAQLLAAKALKKLSWRFHTKYLMWFQRHEEPKQITDDFEEGTYVYFDYEKWSQRKKEQFRFEYRYLEDRELE